ncbi:50S ribosomal protein L21, mitochondrial-like [Quercus lobata]|uniref:50S ribosomal protein L21, mitochondrial-like n=1 Tax=Quercus lobata TaxID=97700 RepID=UPI0012493E89|nr:50S ribosomal protein L21, mitochondrial-like [Quercus lobata]
MAITIRLKHWQTALTHHGASLLSCLQTQTQTPSRSLCSLLSPTNSEEDQKRGQNEEQKEMFRMNYKVDAASHDTRQPFKPSVFFYIGNQGHEASVGDFIFTERLKYVDVKDKVEFTKVGLVSLKRKLFLRHPLQRLLQNAYVKTVVEAHVQEFGKDFTKLRVVDFGFLDDEGRKKNLKF